MRSGRTRRWGPGAVERVLATPVPIDGRNVTPSDHAGLVADLALEPGGHPVHEVEPAALRTLRARVQAALITNDTAMAMHRLETALGGDAVVSSRWRPTAANFWGRIPMRAALAIGKEVLGDAWAERHARDKKAALGQALEVAFAAGAELVDGVTPEARARAACWLPPSSPAARPSCPSPKPCSTASRRTKKGTGAFSCPQLRRATMPALHVHMISGCDEYDSATSLPALARHWAEAFGVRTAWHGPGDVSPVGHLANITLDVTSYAFVDPDPAAPSNTRRLRSTSIVKSTWPGVSIRLSSYSRPSAAR